MTDSIDYCKTCYHPKDQHHWDENFVRNFCKDGDCPCEEYIYGETRTTATSGAQKGVKEERFSLVPVYPLTLLSRLYAFGAKKYAAHNWRKGYEWSKSYDSVIRHLTQFWEGEDIDPETGIPHVICAAFHCFVLAQYMKDHPELDDRYKLDAINDLIETVDNFTRSQEITEEQISNLKGYDSTTLKEDSNKEPPFWYKLEELAADYLKSPMSENHEKATYLLKIARDLKDNNDSI